MGRSKEFDTTLVLHKAMKVFGHYGYEGTTLQHLLDGLGIARQSLYDTYGTKRDLFVMAVQHYVNKKTTEVISRLERLGPVKPAIADIFRTGASVLKDEELRSECFILHSAIDQVPHDQEINAFFKSDMAKLEEAFCRALERAQLQGEISPRQDLRALAQYLNHARYTMTASAKLTADPNVLDNLVQTILSTLDT